jgi:hypothetical protein
MYTTTRFGLPIRLSSISSNSSHVEAATIPHSGNALANRSAIERRVNGFGSINATRCDNLPDPSSLSLFEDDVASGKRDPAVLVVMAPAG